MTSKPLRPLGIWLALWAAFLFILIVIGGITRLTGSGLSITEWKPVSGVIPPLSHDAWVAEFESYKRIPQYRELNTTMTLDGFRRIFFWEFLHRFWARMAGVTFLVPFAIFLLRGMIPRETRGRLVLLLGLLALQGALGWFMVMSGLSGRTSVSQYRLAAHLAAALLIYGATVWIAAGMFAPLRRTLDASTRTFRRGVIAVTAMVSLTAVAGAFVAGLRAGHAYNTFPLMGGRVVPDGYARLTPWIRNIFENVPAVQFNHRLLATLTVALVILTWFRSRTVDLSPRSRTAVGVMVLIACGQFALGIATLVLSVPIALGVAHQAGAVLLLTCCLLLVHSIERTPEGAPGTSVQE